MINEIEQAALQYLTGRITAIRSTGVQADTNGLLVNPALSAACLEGSFKRNAGAWEQLLTLSIMLEFKHAKGKAARREGANPLVEAIFQLLIGQKLGLKIAKLEPLRWREVTNEDDHEEGKSVYLLQFATSYTIEQLDEEEIEELLGIAIDYFLTPGDDQLDAEDQHAA